MCYFSRSHNNIIHNMKYITFLISCIIAGCFHTASAQSMAISNDGSEADASAILELKSDSKGLLIPRVANTGAVPTPATGLLVYVTGTNPGFYYNSGTAASPVWVSLTPTDNSHNTGFMASAINPAGQAVPTGVYSTVIFDSVDFDDPSAFSASTYTCPSTGTYYFDASVTCVMQTVRLAIFVNGNVAKFTVDNNNSSANFMTPTISGIFKCNAGDQVTVRILPIAGNVLVYNFSGAATFFSGYRVY